MKRMFHGFLFVVQIMDDGRLPDRIDNAIRQEYPYRDRDQYHGEMIFRYFFYEILRYFPDIEAIGVMLSDQRIDIDDDQQYGDQ